MIQLRDTITISFRALRDNLVRSLLTILGIVIGVLAIVLVVALGQSSREVILNEVRAFGGNVVMIEPGRQAEGPSDFTSALFSDSITSSDIDALSRPANVPNVQNIIPEVIVSGSMSYRDAIARPLTIGYDAEALATMLDLYPDQGFLFTQDDIKQRSKVVVLGYQVKQDLFGNIDAIGQFVTIKNTRLKVVGTFPKTGQVSFLNVDKLALIPYSTAQKDIMGIDYFNEVLIQTNDDANAEQVAQDVRLTLREEHNITDTTKDDFSVMTQADIATRVSTITNILTIFLVSIAAISLLVAGVGIMNIMLVSVTERTREIGLRKTVGATNNDIMRQFLLEATILTASGGILGTSLALGISWLVAYVVRTQFGLDWPTSFPLNAILLGVGTATLVGLVFGIYPARAAARKDPIEALRYE